MIREAHYRVTSLDLADELRPALIRLARALRRETEQLGVTSQQAALLWHVQRSPGLSLRELAEEEGISPPSLSGHVDRLEALGMVTRVRSTGDRRRVGLVLTPDGERLVRRVRTRRTTWLAARLEALEPDERESIARALPALLALLDEDGA
jgi:DNA-binding MarR family transcriptional regulator